MHDYFSGALLPYSFIGTSDGALKLLKTMSAKELRLLYRHRDLLPRIEELAGLSTADLVSEVETNYGLEIDYLPTGDITINPEEVIEEVFFCQLDDYPTAGWGWDIDGGWAELGNWARRFLLQEIKIELWFRYMVHKSKKRKEDANLRMQEIEDEIENAGGYYAWA